MFLINIVIPGRKQYKFQHLLLDLNGTIAVDGKIIEGVKDRLYQLSQLINICIITADTHGTAAKLEREIPIKIHKINCGEEKEQKRKMINQLGNKNTISIGNGSNDVYMLRDSGLGICVLGREGAATEAVINCDLLVQDINDALDLLIEPSRLVATLRQ